jgi:nickel-dependent lactate racemase
MIYYEHGGPQVEIDGDGLSDGLALALDRLGRSKRVIVVPPDFTRYPSQAGRLTEAAYAYLGDRLAAVLPAIGTHHPMTDEQIAAMFPSVPKGLFRVHDWRHDLVTLGRIEPAMINRVSEGRLDFDWPAQVNSLLVDKQYDLILSVGQVVPHEVIGMANYNKNIFVGAGGAEGIAKSHYLGAVYGMERIMGRADSPVREVLNEATRRFGSRMPVVYVLTVVQAIAEPDGGTRLAVRGLFIGDDEECYYRAAELARQVNVILLDRPIKKAVAYMDPAEYTSTWVANKAIYRTRMALADGAELVVIAPGVRQFGENEEFDRLIAHYGYHGTEATLDAVERHPDLAGSLGVAAHLIHGSSDGRFTITYAAGGIDSSTIERAGFVPGSVDELSARYCTSGIREGWNRMPDGDEIYYISNPGLGLWATRSRFT